MPTKKTKSKARIDHGRFPTMLHLIAAKGSNQKHFNLLVADQVAYMKGRLHTLELKVAIMAGQAKPATAIELHAALSAAGVAEGPPPAAPARPESWAVRLQRQVLCRFLGWHTWQQNLFQDGGLMINTHTCARCGAQAGHQQATIVERGDR